MDHKQLEQWTNHHTFNTEKKAAEKRIIIVVVITFMTMTAEIFFGWLSKSMSLLADGWHMGTHAFALGISVLAYWLARKYAGDKSFTFGTWKIEILGAYTSAIVLGIVGLIMIFASLERLINPLSIAYEQALIVAVIGLLVNMVCATILHNARDAHGHDDHHKRGHSHGEKAHSHNEDLNLEAAYLHVVADVMTSIIAIAALLGAKYFHQVWLDPLMGIAGAALILRWSFLLLKDTGNILLVREPDEAMINKIKKEIESDGDSKVSDLHIWKVAQDKYGCVLSLVTAKNCSIDDYRTRLKGVHELGHLTIEVNEYKK